jgi:hypothetical protein
VNLESGFGRRGRHARGDVLRSFGDSVIDVRDEELEVELVRQARENVEQARRVRPPRERDDDFLAALEEISALDRSLNALDDIEPRAAVSGLA